MDQVNKDKRFAHVAKDPRFRRMPREVRKVKIDKRFKSMFSDERFKVKYQVDKRGRPVQTSSNENLKKYYDLHSSEESNKSDSDSIDSEADDEENENQKPDVQKSKPKVKSSSELADIKKQSSCSSAESDDKNEEEKSENDDKVDDFLRASDAIKQGIDLARGEGNLSSSSDEESDDSDVDDDDGVQFLDHRWGELEADAIQAKEITRRLALCNMDWDRIKAQDILVLMNSFRPLGGQVESVKIYPSEYGLKRIEEDNHLGPVELRSHKNNPDDSSDEEDSEIYTEKLRQYQINRLKYYYAVITCNSAETADAIYEQCDGLEYETSSSKIDLRFIPDDMEFEHEAVSVADRVLDGINYKPSFFVTSALNQTKVDLTWEETDPDRLKVTMKKFSKDEIDEMDLKAYLASDSDEETKVGRGNEELNKFRSLLVESAPITEKTEDGNMEMEITWELGLKTATEKAVKQKVKGGQTPWEKYMEKRAQKKREKLDEKMKMKKMKEQEPNESEQASDDDVPEGVDMNDPFFKDAYSDEENYEKKPKKSEKLKQKKKGKKDIPKEQVTDPHLHLLVMDEDDNRQHFSLEQIMKNEQKKKKNQLKKNNEDDISMKEDTFRFNLADDRFSAMYTSSAYNIDPSAPDYKKTKTMEDIVTEKMKRRVKEGDRPAKKLKTEASQEGNSIESIQSLVKSVKARMSRDVKKLKKTTLKM